MGLLSKPELLKLAVQFALESELDPALVCAHIDVRSQWNSGFSLPTAVNYMGHTQFPDPLESEYRSIQWGLMAIGGEFARAEGYSKELSLLLRPIDNLREGCRLLFALQQNYVEPVRSVVESLLTWNRENARELVAQTLAKIESYRALIARIPEIPRTFQGDGTIPLQVRSQIEGNDLLEVGSTMHTQIRP